MAFQIQPSPTVWAFMEAEAFVLILRGPRGEGKSWGGFLRLLHKANQLPAHTRPLRGAVIRDTLVNLRRTTITALRELEARGLEVQWRHDEGHESEAILGRNLVHLYFFGLDRLAEVSKLQGLGLGFLWLEEPAPAADLSGGIPPEVFGVGATCLRQAGVSGWIQLTMNPPDADHWTMQVAARLEDLTRTHPDLAACRVKVFRIPAGENPHVAPAERLKWRAGLEATGRADLIARLIEGRVGQVVLGEPVVAEYSDESHVAPEPLPILRQSPILRAWDFGLTPVCIWSQITPKGHWHLLWAVQDVNVGIEQLIETHVKPWESEYLAGHLGGWRDIGDAAGRQREQRNSEASAAASLEARLDTTLETGPIDWPSRRDALRAVFGRTLRGGVPMVRVDPEARLIRRALRGGWHYPKDGLGRILPTLEAAKRASGLHDHVGHALGHGASVLFPVGVRQAGRKPPPVRVEADRYSVPELGWLGS